MVIKTTSIISGGGECSVKYPNGFFGLGADGLQRNRSITINAAAGPHNVLLRANGRVIVNWFRFTGTPNNSNNARAVELETLSNLDAFSPFAAQFDSAPSKHRQHLAK